MLTQTQLKTILHYDPATGVFRWLVEMSTRAKQGEIAGGMVAKSNSRQIKIHTVNYPTSRLAFLYMEGEWPKGYVRRVNKDSSDDAYDNLVDTAKTSKYVGVCWNQRESKWVAYTCADDKQKNLGYFDTEEEAYEAVKIKERTLQALRDNDIEEFYRIWIDLNKPLSFMHWWEDTTLERSPSHEWAKAMEWWLMKREAFEDTL